VSENVGSISAFLAATSPGLIASTLAGSFDYDVISFTILLFFSANSLGRWKAALLTPCSYRRYRMGI
jgi:asparagine N-glycosylation enzyme membrane subunit Stt3